MASIATAWAFTATAEDPWGEALRVSYAAAPRRQGDRRRVARLRALAGVFSCIGLGVAYALLAYWIVSGLHIGHVVQDGLDTGDMLAVPPLGMSMLSVVLATACLHRFQTLSPRRRR